MPPKPLKIESDRLYENQNMTVHVVDKRNQSGCPKASFRGFPKHLSKFTPNIVLICTLNVQNNSVALHPPKNVSFLRRSRRLEVNVTWKQEDVKATEIYLRYKALNGVLWNESSTAMEKWTAENLHPSLSYVVQIRCRPNARCPQCPWSPLYTLPPELNVQPVILSVEDNDIPGRHGCRLLLISWKFPYRELVDGYNVTIGKASGELPSNGITTSQLQLRLIVSYSAYQLQITAFNKASTSPAASQTIPPRKHMVSDSGGKKLNVTFHSNKSLTLTWRDTQKYVCYSVELSSREHKTQYFTFFENKKNYRLITLKGL
ncbi:hypothetical protein N1851_003354 [Merluccius polli]|uniref:Fibronectin type-III domain-containing protein n=1 Tax=Merluccius polli TaxID=89951 RepID=A0AA47NAE5_MERPO|nr:hypothetical protein N1851_003354 [Merluccius polli]